MEISARNLPMVRSKNLMLIYTLGMNGGLVTWNIKNKIQCMKDSAIELFLALLLYFPGSKNLRGEKGRDNGGKSLFAENAREGPAGKIPL